MAAMCVKPVSGEGGVGREIHVEETVIWNMACKNCELEK